MTTYEPDQITEVPTLRNVIKNGKESIIQTTRIGNQLEYEMGKNLGSALSEELILAMARHKYASVDNQRDADATTTDYRVEHVSDLATTARSAAQYDMDDTLELLIDDIVDRHVSILRRDIRQLLEQVLVRQ